MKKLEGISRGMY